MTAPSMTKKASVTAAEVAEAIALFLNRGWLRDVPDTLRDWLLAECSWRRFAPGDSLAREGDPVGGLYGIATGSFMFEASLATGDVARLDLRHGPFWLLSRSMLPGAGRLVTTIARSDILACYIPQAALWRFLTDNPELRPHITRVVGETLEVTLAALADALIPDNRLRAIATLLRIGGRQQDGDTPSEVPIGQDELASLSNLSRQTIGDVLRALAADGLVTLGYRRITIEAPARLRSLLTQG
jgi:CRP/FNR family transcriptional regulator, cyclic AMP receptor protein